MTSPSITCRFCERPAKVKCARLCGAHDQQRRRSGLDIAEFVAAMDRGEQPGIVRHTCPECGREHVGGHRVTCSDACETARRRRRQREAMQRAYARDPERQRQLALERRRKRPEVYRAHDRRRRAKLQQQRRRACRECGADITGTHRRDWCSDACREIAYRRARRSAPPTEKPGRSSPPDGKTSALERALALAPIALANRPTSAGRYMHECRHCGREFRSRTGRAIYCSRTCKTAARPKVGTVLHDRVCAVCGAAFQAQGPHALYCSGDCRRVSLAERKRRGPAAVPRECVVCGVTFLADRRNATTCSTECRAEDKRRKMRAAGSTPEARERQKLLARKRLNVQLNCVVCGRDMSDLPDLRTHRYTCSETCRVEARRQRARRTYLARRNRVDGAG